MASGCLNAVWLRLLLIHPLRIGVLAQIGVGKAAVGGDFAAEPGGAGKGGVVIHLCGQAWGRDGGVFLHPVHSCGQACERMWTKQGSLPHRLHTGCTVSRACLHTLSTGVDLRIPAELLTLGVRAQTPQAL